jgi:hypothetical protein
MRTKKYNGTNPEKLSEFPNFHRSGSIKGMKRMYYGVNSLLVRNGGYIYNVTSRPDIYYSKSI